VPLAAPHGCKDTLTGDIPDSSPEYGRGVSPPTRNIPGGLRRAEGQRAGEGRDRSGEDPPLRLGSPIQGIAAAGGGRSESGIQRIIPSDPGIRVPLHPPRRRCPPSPYRSGYASVRRLAGSGASTLSMHGLFRNGPPDAGAQTCGIIARRATNGAPLRRSFPEQRYNAADGGGCRAVCAHDVGKESSSYLKFPFPISV